MPPSKTLYIVDRDGELARSLASLLASRCLRVEIRSDGEDLLANFDARRAACVLVESHAPGMSALEIGRQLRRRGVVIPVILIAVLAIASLSAQAMGATFGGHPSLPRMGKALAVSARARKLEAVDTPESDLPPGSSGLPATEVLRERFQRLTPREREIARLVAEGHTSKELARKLNLSKSTVDNHRAHILEKLQLDNFVQVARSLSVLLTEK